MAFEDYHELLDSKITLHDKQRFEVKLDVMLSEEQPAGQYTVEAFFFLPRSLGLDSRSYPSSAFYGDIQNYIRFKTPVIGLRKLGDGGYEYCPFKRLDAAVDLILSGDRSDSLIVKAVHELKLLGCVVRSDVRDHVYFLMVEADRLGLGCAAEEAKPLEENAKQFLEDLDFLLGKLREVRPRILNPALPERVRDAYERLDEFVSLTVESYLTILLGRPPERAEFWKRLPELDALLKRRIAAEQEHRRAMGYPSLVAAGSDNEEFAQRRSLLKKYISSLLYLDMDILEASTAREFVLSLAAGGAMLISVVAMLWVQSRYTFNSFVFVAAAVGTYMFKDRIKDWLKRYFTSALGGWLVDQSVHIVDPSSRNVIGKFKEAVSFLSAKDVPDEIRRARGSHPASELGETVLKYIKHVRLKPPTILEHHHRLKAINDILRFSVSNFLGRMDDPKSDHLFYNPKTDRLEGARIARTYPVDVVFRLQAENGKSVETHFERIRLVLTRKGIKRMESGANGAGPSA